MFGGPSANIASLQSIEPYDLAKNCFFPARQEEQYLDDSEYLGHQENEDPAELLAPRLEPGAATMSFKPSDTYASLRARTLAHPQLTSESDE
jgi:hypothetical protein